MQWFFCPWIELTRKEDSLFLVFWFAGKVLDLVGKQKTRSLSEAGLV